MWPFVPGYFSCSIMFSRVGMYFIPFYCHIMFHCVDSPRLFMHSSADGHLAHFYVLAIGTNVAVNIHI